MAKTMASLQAFPSTLLSRAWSRALIPFPFPFERLPRRLLEDVFEFCWSSLADEHNTLPKPTRRHIKLDKFIFGTPWLPDLLCKHWFASSVWNFCHWVADVPLRKTSPAAKSEEKRMFSQARDHSYWKRKKISSTFSWAFSVKHYIIIISSLLELLSTFLHE